MLDKPDLGKYKPSCNLAHGLVNKISVIVGYCDILKDYVESGSECEKRLKHIREIAVQMATELNDHQCEIELLLREPPKEPRTVKISAQASKPA